VLQLREAGSPPLRKISGKGQQGRGPEEGHGRAWAAEILLQGDIPGAC